MKPGDVILVAENVVVDSVEKFWVTLKIPTKDEPVILNVRVVDCSNKSEVKVGQVGEVYRCKSNIGGEWNKFVTKENKETFLNKLNMSATQREIIFRGRSKETGEWVEGNYHHNIRKGTWHSISPKDTNEPVMIYRESLEMKDWDGNWVSV